MTIVSVDYTVAENGRVDELYARQRQISSDSTSDWYRDRGTFQLVVGYKISETVLSCFIKDSTSGTAAAIGVTS